MSPNEGEPREGLTMMSGEPAEPEAPAAPSALRRARAERGWGVKGVARRLTTRLREQGGEVGRSSTVTPAMVRAWERGYPNGSRPQERHRRNLCALYEKTEEELGIDQASWPWPRHKPAKAPPRPRADRTIQHRTRYDSDERTAPGRMTPTSVAELLVRAQTSGEGMSVERQRFLQAMAALGLGAVVDGVGGLLAPKDVFEFFASGPDAADRVLDVSGVAEGTLADLEAHTSRLWDAWYTTGFSMASAIAVVPLRAHLGTILTLIDRPERPAARRRLCAQAAHTSELLRVAAWDLDFPDVARRYVSVACRAAEQSEDPNLWAQMLADRAYINQQASTRRLLPYSEDPAVKRSAAERSLDGLGRARRLVEQGVSAWVLARNKVQEAIAFAMLGRREEAEASLEAAERALERARPHDGSFATGAYSPAVFACNKAKVYLLLGLPALATAGFRESLALHGSAKHVNRAAAQLSVALAGVQGGQLDMGLEEASLACQLAEELPVAGTQLYVHELRIALAPHRDVPDVQQLDRRLASIAA